MQIERDHPANRHRLKCMLDIGSRTKRVKGISVILDGEIKLATGTLKRVPGARRSANLSATTEVLAYLLTSTALNQAVGSRHSFVIKGRKVCTTLRDASRTTGRVIYDAGLRGILETPDSDTSQSLVGCLEIVLQLHGKQQPLTLEEMRAVAAPLERKLRSWGLQKSVSAIPLDSPEFEIVELPRMPINRDTIDRASMSVRRRFFADCPVVTSSPGVLMFSGEKVGARGGASQALMHVARRVFVGLRPTSTGVLDIGSNRLLRVDPNKPDPCEVTAGLIDTLAYEFLAAGVRRHLGPTKPSADLYVFTEWAGESGLAFSAALASATAGALLALLGYTFDTTGDPRSWSGTERKLFALAWLFESAIHGGRSSGASLAATLTHSPFPIVYRTSSEQPPPRLWKVANDPDDLDTPDKEGAIDQVDRLTDRFWSFVVADNPAWDIRRLDTAVGSNQDMCLAWRRMVQIANVLAVDTGTTGSTAATSEAELLGAATAPGYEHVIEAMRSSSTAIAEHVQAWVETAVMQYDDGRSDPESLRMRLVELLIRHRGLLMGHGISFPRGDAMLGVLRLEDGSPTNSPDIGGKSSGKGSAGNLLIVHKLTEALSERIHGRVYNFEPGETGVLYDAAIDGPETDGLRLERVNGQWLDTSYK